MQGSGLDPLVVVVDRDRKDLLRVDLPNDEFVQEGRNFARGREVFENEFGSITKLVRDDVVAQVNALIADVHAGSRDELLNLFLTLSAETALNQVVTFAKLCH